MLVEEIQKYVGLIIALIVAIGGFIYWHFKTINGFKDEIHKLALKQKELEHRDELQQQTIDQLNELYPIFTSVFEKLNRKKK